MKATAASGTIASGAAVLAALGVVFGDIGTSPLYAFKEAVAAAAIALGTREAVLGVLSLIFWSVLLVVSVKYVGLMLRADNDGEGGVLALLALVQLKSPATSVWTRRALALGVLGTALFYCDALITPAISVLSAVEGLELLDPTLERAVVPATIVIVILLFGIQSRGTARIGRYFGPIMILWFTALAALGLNAIAANPAVLSALHPLHAAQVLTGSPGVSLTIIGAVFLALTGAETLYADMGHFGARAVRLAWFGVVWPSLMLNYFGQGALLLGAEALIERPFFTLAPAPLLPVLVVTATLATVIASQAVISGAFSITRQAIQLDLLPRLTIRQTSETEQGQIYVPLVNTLMLLAVGLFVVGFGSSSALSSAYGAAVIGTMLITTLLGAIVARSVWAWGLPAVAAVFAAFLLVDLVFLVGNLGKIPSGGWIPLLLAAVLFGVFVVWRDGRVMLRAELAARAVPLREAGRLLEGVTRVPGTAVFLASNAGFVPTALLRNLEHNHVLHEQVIILHMAIARVPRADAAQRVRVEEIAPGMLALRASFGFMEQPDVRVALRAARTLGVRLSPKRTSYFVGWHLVRARPHSGWLGLKLRLFAWMQRRSAQAAEFFNMPTRGVVVLASDIEL